MARTIKVDYLARVEGEGSLEIRVKRGKVESVRFSIFEPPRLFEALLRGRSFLEAPDITARICGICPVAYQMSSCAAMEDAMGVVVPERIRLLRRILYCAEWMESHALHVFMLHAPDFLGFADGIAMAKAHPDLVRDALRIKKTGNALLSGVGGREIHPVNVRVGGFYRAPRRDELGAHLSELRWARGAAARLLRQLAGLKFPELERPFVFVALRHGSDYPMSEGRIVASTGLDIAPADYERHFVEEHVAHSTALRSRLAGSAYLCGPLARFNASFHLLSPLARDAAREAGIAPPCTNPFKSLLVRAVELLWACDEATRLVEAYEPPEPCHVPVPVRAGIGHGATEAPRGLLYHRYEVDGRGLVVSAKIVPPTSQNQETIEDDLRALAPTLLGMPHEEATMRAEQAVRNYDPCISCATHFLELRILDA